VKSALKSKYDRIAASGEIITDPAQIAVLDELDKIRTYLEATSERQRGMLSGLLSRKVTPPPGVYIWGGVGAGKSMLMDMFFATTDISRKRRVHFHAFMQEIHTALSRARRSGTVDPVTPVAQAVAAQARLLCFDEMQISDITDAMIVGRLFEKLFAAGVIIVTTSNRMPDELYKHGLNRQLFLPFIALIKARMRAHHLNTEADYRQLKLKGVKTWFSPLGPESSAALESIWQDLTRGKGEALALCVQSREVVLPSFFNGVARAGFADLCEAPLGPADFLAISQAVRLLILDDIPKLSRAKANEAKRFVILIDTLYEAKVRLICSAEAVPEQLYKSGPGAFEFARTASRLREMQAEGWGAAIQPPSR
jgi:cell division protein ZapE